MTSRSLAGAALAALVACAPRPPALVPVAGPRTADAPDVVYVPTEPKVVQAMLDLARVRHGDVVYDLGCGDGRIVIAAAKRGAKKAVGVEIDPALVREARENARAARVEDDVTFIEGDLFQVDFSDATVVMLYLYRDLNLLLRPKLLALEPGTRIVSHEFDMGDWTPTVKRRVEGATLYEWIVPGREPPPGAGGR